MSSKPRKKGRKKKVKKNTTPKPKIVVIEICKEEIEVDLNNLDPKLKTHCIICGDDLTPEWQREMGKERRVPDDRIGAACHYCSSVYDKTPGKIKEEIKEYRRSKRKKPALRVSKKMRKKIEERGKQLNKRPCGCGARGRHRKDCPLRKEGNND